MCNFGTSPKKLKESAADAILQSHMEEVSIQPDIFFSFLFKHDKHGMCHLSYAK